MSKALLTLALVVGYAASVAAITFLATDPRDIDDQSKAGDVRLSVLYNLNQETLTLPALGAKLAVNLPTGIESSGVDVEVKGITTKSFDRLGVHLNGGYRFLNGTKSDERDGRYELTLGATYPIGAPQYTRTGPVCRSPLFIRTGVSVGF